MTRGFPAPGLIKLCAPITVSTNVATEISPDPDGTSVDLGTAFVAVLKVTSFPTGGTSTTLSVNLQTTYDDGT
jgi:hypothetical protein